MSTLQGPSKRVDVAFVTINYNTKALVEQLVDFLETATVPFTYSVTVVDNNSTDGSLDEIAKNPDILLIRNDQNVGYGRAANMGVRASQSDYVCVLNTDVILNERALTAMWRYLEENRTVGGCSPVVRYDNGQIQGFTFSFSPRVGAYDFLAKLHGKLMKLLFTFSRRPIRVDGIKGALLFLRRAYIEDDTLFDEDFFFYFEDTDLAYRWYLKGYPSVVLPTESIIHLGGKSSSSILSTQYYESFNLYRAKHCGDDSARNSMQADLDRIGRKVALYRLLGLVWPSSGVRWKLRHYRECLHVLNKEHRPGGTDRT